MAIRIAINGFGRIGRLVLRAAYESGRRDLQFVAINDLGSVEANAHLLKWDSVHGRFPGEIQTREDGFDLGNFGFVKVLAERDPSKLPWREMQIDVVMECTGIFTKRDAAAKHLEAGAKRVLISAPATDPDLTVVYGVNHKALKAEHKIVSNASCTTNCLAPVAHVLHQTVGIQRGYMTTIHSYTGDQPTVDTLHKDMHRARAAAVNIIPTSTGAAKAIGLVLPELKGKLDGTAIRVPTPNVSLIDLVVSTEKEASAEAINEAMKKAAGGALKGVLEISSEPLVSSDFNHNPASSTFDVKQTQVIEGKLARVLAWYDNEWGFSNRMSDTAAALGKLG
ncbi:MAG TPA: type I glyceraldehyde-3-phosphate dehydrogenase [Methylomirabilota bacterium]|jgi:glyceraldehyde 3-phosphate dehydrogenase|nr:type I glyceraldehyde-3-phosphate dehydrogenase [Methylomirabilota bacterium]